MFANHPQVAARWYAEYGHAGQGKRHDPIPVVQAGGHQPFSKHGGQMPGPSLTAMLAGRTFGGINPMDTQRGLQVASKRPRTLADLLAG